MLRFRNIGRLAESPGPRILVAEEIPQAAENRSLTAIGSSESRSVLNHPIGESRKGKALQENAAVAS